MAPTPPIGFSSSQTSKINADITRARELAMGAVNSMLVTASGQPKPAVAELLWWAFTVKPDADLWDNLDPIKNAYLAVSPRIDKVAVHHESSSPSSKEIDFDAFVRPGHPNQIFVRDAYFQKDATERAATLIHECMHLIFDDNSGDGHPGGKFAMFGPGNLQISYKDAIRNPYCYMYYAIWVSSLANDRQGGAQPP